MSIIVLFIPFLVFLSAFIVRKESRTMFLLLAYITFVSFTMPYWGTSVSVMMNMTSYFVFLMLAVVYMIITRQRFIFRLDLVDYLVLLFSLLVQIADILNSVTQRDIVEGLATVFYKIVVIFVAFEFGRNIIRKRENLTEALVWISLCGVFMTVLLGWEFMTGKTLMSVLPYFDPNYVRANGVSTSIMETRSGLNRPQAFFGTAVYAGFYLFIAFAASLAVLTIKKNSLLYYFMPLVIFIGIGIIQVRMVYISVALLILYYLVANKKIALRTFAFLAIAVVAVINYAPEIGDFVTELFVSLGNRGAAGSSEYLKNFYDRVDITQYAVNHLFDVPVFGIGKVYLNTGFADYTNYYAGLALRSGIISLLVFITAMIVMTWRIFRNIWLKVPATHLTTLMAFATVLCAVQLWSTSEPEHAFYLLWVFLGILLSKPEMLARHGEISRQELL